MTWPQVALAAINVAQAVALAFIAAWASRTHHEVQRINGELESAVAKADADRAERQRG